MGVRRHAAVALAAQLVLLACSASAHASAACPGDSDQPTIANAYASAMSIVCDINVYRAQNGLRPLRWDWRLWRAAQNQADDMAANHYAGHRSANGMSLSDRVQPTGYIPTVPPWLLGENIGWGTSVMSTPASIVLGWLESPEHRENMLDPQFRDVGVGINQGAVKQKGQSGVIYVADFGMRAAAVDTLRKHGRAGRSRRR
jgi:uncharacterized protein YkwD